jgi:hypothetical protein
MLEEVESRNASSNIFSNVSVEKQYDADSDRLFMIYYALPQGLNSNKWGVSNRSMDMNIKIAINKPVIIYRKEADNPFHREQTGDYIHYTVEQAAAECF